MWWSISWTHPTWKGILYLTLQFMELGVRVCLALNMIDVAGKRGIEIDAARLSGLLSVPVVPTVARNGQGKNELVKAARKIMEEKRVPAPLVISYGDDIDNALVGMEKIINDAGFMTDLYPARWIALKYLENDEQVQTLGQERDPRISAELDRIVKKVAAHISVTLETTPEALIADHRYGYIRSIMKQGVITVRQDQDRLYISDKIDKVVTNRFAGPLIMIGVIMALYHFTFTYSEMPVGWFESFFGWLGETAEAGLPDGMIKSMLVSGVIDGVGGVLGFVPLILFMFFGIALLEDSGYLARVAFMLDRVFRVFGLHGNSVMPFIVSGGIAGGCAVPGVMAARTLKSRQERLATLLTVSLYELRGQASGFRPAGGRLLRGERSRDHAGHHHPLLGRGPGHRPSAAPDRDQGPVHPVCHGTAALPPAHFQGSADPHLGKNLAVH